LDELNANSQTYYFVTNCGNFATFLGREMAGSLLKRRKWGSSGTLKEVERVHISVVILSSRMASQFPPEP
jgi:hypothetical protein